MKQLIVIFSLLCTNVLLGQVDSIEVNGETYYVYPFRQEVNVHYDYWIAVDDDEFYEDYRNFFIYFEESPSFSREKFYEASGAKLDRLNKQLKQRWRWKRSRDGRLGLGRKYVEAVRKNPQTLIDVKYLFNKEVIPPFENIPDGKYVQLFQDFCLVDEDGKCQEQKPRIAAYFNVANNAIEGKAVWMNLQGDTLKEGILENGLKEGTWKVKKLDAGPSSFYRWNVKQFKRTGRIYRDTTVIIADYQHGVLHGDYYTDGDRYSQETFGHYTSGKASGHWEIKWDSLTLMSATYANFEDSVLSHSPIIRTHMPLRNYDYYKYDMTPKEYHLMVVPTNFYEIPFAGNTDLELEEEQFQSHELEYNRYGFDYDDVPKRIKERRDYYQGSDFYRFETDPETKKLETRGFYIDSIGAKMMYDGDYTLYYPNGQLFTRYQFENGSLVNEDTLFWDNGQAHDVIVYVEDSNHYVRTGYDYDGVPFQTLVYDSLGDFSHFVVEKHEIETVEIDGLTATRMDYSYSKKYDKDSTNRGNFYYTNWDAVKDSVYDEVLLYKLWSGFDSSVMTQTTYDPVDRKMIYWEKSYTGETFATIERNFTEDFQGWTGKTTWQLGDFMIEEISSGILGEYENDTFPQRHVSRSYNHYDITTDYTLYLKGEKYSGKAKIKFNKSKFKFSNRKLKTSFAKYFKWKKVKKPLYRYFDKNVIPGDDLLGIANNVNSIGNLQRTTYDELYYGVLGKFFNYDGEDYYGDWGYSYRNLDRIKKVKGRMVEGQPEGTWTGRKTMGRKISEISYLDGEATGVASYYSFEPRAPRWERLSSDEKLPRTRKYYLYSTLNYDNGLSNGLLSIYDWTGEIREEGTYVDGFLEGEYLERYPMAYSVSNFKNGFLDGYTQTYLTLPHQDTILLYELNFQHDLLNGESVAYHTNGRIAKKGFFLDGEPIDDYEAYDTLGFKYHYVKFKYGYPVEEKIWEENELSLRYLFNWEDSVEFDPSDITQTMSLQNLMYKLGYGLDYLEEEYYGRPRLINKEGLQYNMTKFYPNDTIARSGDIVDGKKIGYWSFHSYEGEFLYEVDYFDSIIEINDSIRFKSKGILTDYDASGNKLYKGLIIEKTEKYDCAHTDHYEIRQLHTIWEADDSVGRMNGYAKNYYDNGVLQNEGYMKDGLPTGLWKFYDPYGKLNLMGSYHLGKRHGRWLAGDLSKKKYLGEICLNPSLPDLEEEIQYRENLLDVEITNYWLGKALNRQFYDLNLNKYTEHQD